MTAIQGSCGTCKQPIVLNVGEGIDGSKLVWHSSYVCAQCGADVVMDDDGLPPIEIREKLATANGYWETIVEEVPEPLKAVLVLIEALGLNRVDALRLSKSLPGRVAIGTQTECEWLRQHLSHHGLGVSTRAVSVASGVNKNT